jgi:hypothetical protein
MGRTGNWKGGLALAAVLGLTLVGSAAAQAGGDAADASAARIAEGASTVPGSVIVKSKFGGQIFGFDIDQNGTEGVLSEAQDISGGNVLAAVETFDQKTGQILKVVAKAQTQDDFVTLGVVQNSIGLIEREHVISLLKVSRTFRVLNPLSMNAFTGSWTAPLDGRHIVNQVSRSQGTASVAVFAEDISSNFTPWVFGSNVAANTFGPIAKITDPNFSQGVPPVIAYDSTTNQAVLSQSLGSPTSVPEVGLVDLTTGAFSAFKGTGLGFVNGIAVDSNTGIACTSTEIDYSVEFYNLATHSGTRVLLPNANNQIFSGADVQVDLVNKLFLIAQPVSSTASTGSSIQVFDESGHFVTSINGLSFSNAFNVVPAHIALNPSNRTGFVDGPSSGVTEIQSFTY